MILADYAFAIASFLLVIGGLAVRSAFSRKVQFWFNESMLLLLLASILLLSFYPEHVVSGIFVISPYSLFFMALFTAGMLVINIIAFAYSEEYADFAILSDFALLGMYLISSSGSIISIFLGLELSTIPAVFVILLSRKGMEAGVKLLIMVSLAAAIFSIGMALFYDASGSLSLNPVSQGELLGSALLLFLVSLGIESSIFPFNLLIPDVYQGSQPYLVSMLGGLNKKAAFAAIIQIVILSFLAFHSAFGLIAILAAATMFYGNIVAMLQDNIKRMLAYSSISQAGYILIGIAASTSQGIAASLFQIFSHAFAFIGIMGIVAWLETKNKHNLSDLDGLSSENLFAAVSITVFLLSLIGIPFTTGFIGKFMLFVSAINSGFLWLAILGIINSVISIYYYSKIIIPAFAYQGKARRLSMGKASVVAIAICLAVVVAFGIFPQPIIGAANAAAHVLFLSH